MAAAEGPATPIAPAGPVVASISLVYSAPHEIVVAWTCAGSGSTASSSQSGSSPSREALATIAVQYHVQYSPRYLGRWLEWDETYSVPVARLSGLTPSNRYNVRVRARPAEGAWGSWSVASTDLWTTDSDGGYSSQRSPHATAQLRRFELSHATLVSTALRDEALDTSTVTILGPLLPAGCLATALGITPTTPAPQALDDAGSTISAVSSATTKALGPPVSFWFRRTVAQHVPRSNAPIRTVSRSCDRCGDALGAAGVGRVRLCEECGRFLCGRCRCASVFHALPAVSNADDTPYRALRVCLECALRALGDNCRNTCATVCVPDSGHELHVLCESATLALVRALTRVTEGGRTTLVMPHDPDTSTDEDEDAAPDVARTHGTHDWHWAALSRLLLSAGPAPMTASALALPTARRDRFVTVPICVCAANGQVYLPSPDVHPCCSFRDALAVTTTQLEYMTLLNETGASACTHMRVHREVQPYSRARGHDDVEASVATVYPCLQTHHKLDVVHDVAAFAALSRVNVCATAASVAHVSGWIRQAHTDIIREPGVVLEVDVDAGAAFMSDAAAHGLELQPLASDDAPWLGAARSARSTAATASSALPASKTCMYAPMGSDEHVAAYVCTLAGTISSIIRSRWSGLLALVGNDDALRAACLAAGAAADENTCGPLRERVRSLVHSAAGGDAHAIAHEIYGTGNRSDTGEPRRSLVVLKHVQPSAWGACDLAPEHTRARAPVRVGVTGTDSIMLETVDLYAVLDMSDLEGNVWSYIQPVVTHKLVWRDGGAHASVDPPDSDATSPRSDAGAPSALEVLHALILQCLPDRDASTPDAPSAVDPSRTLRFSSHDTTPPTSPAASPARTLAHAYSGGGSIVDPVLLWLLLTHAPQLMDAYRVCTCPPAGRSPGETIAHIVDVSNIGALKDALTYVHDDDDSSTQRGTAATPTSPLYTMLWGADAAEKPLNVRDHLNAAVMRELERMGVPLPPCGDDIHIALADNLSGTALDESVGWRAAVALGMGSGVAGSGFKSAPASRRQSPISTPTPSARALRFGAGSPAAGSPPPSTPASTPGRVYAIIRAGSREVETASHAIHIDPRTPFASIPRWNEGARFIWDGTSALTLSLWYTTAAPTDSAAGVSPGASGGICLGSVVVSLMALERGVPVRIVLPVTIRVHTRVKVPVLPQPRRETRTTTISSSSLTDPAPEVEVDSIAVTSTTAAGKRWSKVRLEAVKALDAAKRRARARTHFVGSGPVETQPVSMSSLLSTQPEPPHAASSVMLRVPSMGSLPVGSSSAGAAASARQASTGVYDVYVDLVAAHVRLELYYYPRAIIPHTPAAHVAREAKRAAKRAKKQAAKAAAEAKVAGDSEFLSLDLNDMIAGRISRDDAAPSEATDAAIAGGSSEPPPSSPREENGLS